MQTGFEGCIYFSSIKSCIQKTCAVSLVREALRISLPLFWTTPSTRTSTKLIKIPVLVLRHLNIPIIIYLDDMLLIDHTIEEPLMARDTVIFLLQQLGFALNLKKSELTPTQRIEILGVTIDSLIMTLSLPEKKVSKVPKQFQELLQNTKKSILELKKLAGLLPSTIQAVLPVQINFRYLQQQPIEALKTKGLCCKKVVLNGNSKEELQWWIKNLKICNGRYVIQFHSQILIQTDASRKRWSVVCQGISAGGQCSKEEQLLQQLLTERSKISTFDLQQIKIFESSSFSNRQQKGEPNDTEIKQRNLAVSLETPDHNYCRIPSKIFDCGGRLAFSKQQ